MAEGRRRDRRSSRQVLRVHGADGWTWLLPGSRGVFAETTNPVLSLFLRIVKQPFPQKSAAAVYLTNILIPTSWKEHSRAPSVSGGFHGCETPTPNEQHSYKHCPPRRDETPPTGQRS